MASLIRKPRSKFWFACFRDANGRQRRKSTKTSDRKKAIKIAEQYEQVAQRKMPARAVRETLAELYRDLQRKPSDRDRPRVHRKLAQHEAAGNIAGNAG